MPSILPPGAFQSGAPDLSATFQGLASDLAGHLVGRGITSLSPIQAATMADLLSGRDVCAAAPTGSGKTLAFGAPLIARLGKGKPKRPAALVLSPTRELAAQTHKVLSDLGAVRSRWSGVVYGGVKQGPQVDDLRKGVDVLVACPGRLEDLIEQGHVILDNVRIAVVDEADRMSDMGFLPAVRRILDQCSPRRQTMLFSATLDGASDNLARTHLTDPARHAVAAQAEDISRSTHLFWSTTTDERGALCADIVRRAGRTIVFTRTKHGADRLADRLDRLGVRAAAIHGGRTQAQRDRSLAAFHAGRVDALVATDVAARGIHVDGVTCVVHFDLPDNAIDYQHRSGRTARAGATGIVVSLVPPEQRRHARTLRRIDGPTAELTEPNLDALGPETATRAALDAPAAKAAQPARSARLGREHPRRVGLDGRPLRPHRRRAFEQHPGGVSQRSRPRPAR